MTQTKKKFIIAGAGALALTVLFNLLPNGVQIAVTFAAAAGAAAGWLAKGWVGNTTAKKEA